MSFEGPFKKQFVVLTSWFSMRSGNSGESKHPFDSLEDAVAWATKRQATEDDVTAITEMWLPVKEKR